jgi:hypothetical protein
MIPNGPLVFTCPADLLKPAPAACKHLSYELDSEGYHCEDCGIPLVFCWACVDVVILTGAARQHVHELPECDDVALRVYKKATR